MKILYDEAFYYKLLYQCGYEEEVENWINDIGKYNDILEDIELELTFAQGKINETISCLHNYVGDHKIQDKDVCKKLRYFIYNKLNKNEISIEKAINSLYEFAFISVRCYEDYWHDFYLIGAEYDLVMNHILDESTYITMVKDFLENGTSFDTEILWNKRLGK